MGRGMSARNISFSQFYCTQCGHRGIDIPRRMGSEREAGHLKKLYCLTCGKETNHVECKPFTHYTYEDFVTEWEYENFTPEGQRVKSYGELRGDIHNGKAERKKTLDDGRSAGIGEEHLDN